MNISVDRLRSFVDSIAAFWLDAGYIYNESIERKHSSLEARLVREHARANGHELDECFAYSDSYSDVPMLSVVGHPAAVNPDRKLRLLANAYHWPIIHLTRAA